MQAEVDSEVLEAARQAEATAPCTTGRSRARPRMFEDVYKEMPRHLREQRQQLGF